MRACTTLSGGPSPTDFLAVDDDGAVYLNGDAIFAEDDGIASGTVLPVEFNAVNGDLLSVIAQDG